MRLTSAIQAMAVSELVDRITNLEGMATSDMSHRELSQTLSSYEQSRSLVMWHDHATILKMGFLMITAHTLYDPAVFYTDEEYQQKHPNHTSICIQSEVEKPEIYLLSLGGGSSVEDQVALVGDRIDCLEDLSLTLDADSHSATKPEVHIRTRNFIYATTARRQHHCDSRSIWHFSAECSGFPFLHRGLISRTS